jgi:uncharacterized protein YtpQ (UPF0354 family)
MLNPAVEKPTKKQFADLVTAGIRERGESRTIVHDEAGFSLHIAPESDMQRTLFLGNSYAEYCAATNEAARQELLHNLSMSALTVEGEESLDEVRVNLMPRVRPRTFYEIGVQKAAQAIAKPGAKVSEKGIPFEPLAEHLGMGIAIDRPTSIQEVADLDKWKVTFEELREIALSNLRRKSKEDFVKLAPAVYVSPWRDHYDPERMLLVDKIKALEVRGDPVVMIPNRHTLLLTGSAEPEGLAGVLRLALEALEGPRPLTARAFVLRGEQWQPFEPAGDDPTSTQLRNLAMQELGSAYTEQKQWLEEKLGEAGEDVFVASIMAAEKDGRHVQLSVWSSGVDTLLPETALIALNDMERGRHVIAPREVVREVVGDLFEKREGLYPPRWRVCEFPTPAQLDRIEQLAKTRMPAGFEGMNDKQPERPAAQEPGAGATPMPASRPPVWTEPQRRSGPRPLWIVLGAITVLLSGVRICLRASSHSSLPSYPTTYTPITLPTPTPRPLSTHKSPAGPKPTGASSGTLLATAQNPTALALDDQRVYWIDGAKGQILSAPRKVAANTKPTVVASASAIGRRYAQSMVIDGDALYALRGAGAEGEAAVIKVPKAGGAASVVAELPGAPEAIATAGGVAYVATSGKGEDGAILRVPLRAGAKPEKIATAVQPCALFADAKDVFFVERGLTTGGVKRLPLKGGSVEAVAQSAGIACSIAGDDDNVYWPVPEEDTVIIYSRAAADTNILGPFAAKPALVTVEKGALYVLSARAPDDLDEDGSVYVLGKSDRKPRLLVAGEPGLSSLAVRKNEVYWSRFDDGDGEGAIATALDAPKPAPSPSARAPAPSASR